MIDPETVDDAIDHLLETVAATNRLVSTLCGVDLGALPDQEVFELFPQPNRFFDGPITNRDIGKFIAANLNGCLKLLNEQCK